MPGSRGTGIDLKSNPFCDCPGFLPLCGISTAGRGQHSGEVTVAVQIPSVPHPTDSCSSPALLLALLWTRMSELDVGDVSQLSPVPHIPTQHHQIVTTSLSFR